MLTYEDDTVQRRLNKLCRTLVGDFLTPGGFHSNFEQLDNFSPGKMGW